jgi:hypothetical protein
MLNIINKQTTDQSNPVLHVLEEMLHGLVLLLAELQDKSFIEAMTKLSNKLHSSTAEMTIFAFEFRHLELVESVRTGCVWLDTAISSGFLCNFSVL